MSTHRDVAEVLNRDFLETRSKILELAASLDRLDRAPGPFLDHPPDRRLAQLRQGLEALLEPGPGRAETVQLLFSLEYDPEWREKAGLRRASPLIAKTARLAVKGQAKEGKVGGAHPT